MIETEQPVVNCDKDHGPNKRISRIFLTFWKTLIEFPRTSNFRIKKLCCMCLRATKQWLRWSSKGRSPTMRHVSRTHRVALDWFFDRINLDPKIQIKHRHQKPTCRQSNQRKFHTWRMESFVVFCSKLAISVHSLFWSDGKKSTSKFRRRASHNEIATNDDPYCKGFLGSVIFGVRKLGKKAMEIKIPGVRNLRKRKERSNPLWAATQEPHLATNKLLKALTQHATQRGMLTKLGLLKSGKLTNRWMIERSNPLWSLKEKEFHSNYHWKRRNRFKIVIGI